MANITIKHGDMFEHVKSGHILHGCNAQGVMGGGVALVIRHKFPPAYDLYRIRHSSKGLTLGTAYPIPCGDITIWNMITQEYYGALHKELDMNLIETAFKDFLHKFKDAGDIHMPLIGCGLAKGKMEVVIPVICDILSVLENNVTIWVLEEEMVTQLYTAISKRGNDNV